MLRERITDAFSTGSEGDDTGETPGDEHPDDHPPETDLTATEIAEIIRQDRRVKAVERVGNDPGITTADLATGIARTEAEDPENPTKSERKRVYVSLYQTHLPRLDEFGVLDTPRDGHDGVHPGPNHDAAMAAIRSIREIADA